MNKFNTKTVLAASVIMASALLAGCGGGSDSGSSKPTAPEVSYGSIDGAVQKGPLQPGSVVTAFELNEALAKTGREHTTQINDYEGNYDLEGEFADTYLELVAEGYYFNELTGSTADQMTMSAFVDIDSASEVNFNTATAVMKDAIMSKVQAGVSFDDAVKATTIDLLNLYSYDAEQWADVINFYNVNLSNSGDVSTMLLVISASTVAMADNDGLTLEQQINELGKILINPESAEFAEAKQALTQYSLALYKTAAYENTQKYYADNGLDFDIPHVDYFIDIDGDGVLPNKDLPVFRYTSGISVGVNEETIGSQYPAGVSAIDYQGRPMTFEVIGEFKHGEIASIEYTDKGVSIWYRLTNVDFEGIVDDCVTVNTVQPAPANFTYDACITLNHNKDAL